MSSIAYQLAYGLVSQPAYGLTDLHPTNPSADNSILWDANETSDLLWDANADSFILWS